MRDRQVKAVLVAPDLHEAHWVEMPEVIVVSGAWLRSLAAVTQGETMIGSHPPVPVRGAAVYDRAHDRIGEVVDYLQDPSVCMPWLVLRDNAGEWKTLLPDAAEPSAIYDDHTLTLKTLALLATTPITIPDQMRRAALAQLVRLQHSHDSTGTS